MYIIFDLGANFILRLAHKQSFVYTFFSLCYHYIVIHYIIVVHLNNSQAYKKIMITNYNNVSCVIIVTQYKFNIIT